MRTIERQQIDPDLVRKIIADKELYAALRYVAGPPISEDDLGVLVTRNVSGFKKSQLRKDDDLVSDIIDLICRLSDPVRFPWVLQNRKPYAHEIRTAAMSTSVLHATQSIQTERRGFGRKLERDFAIKLEAYGFNRISAPNKGKIAAPIDHPVYPDFYGECTVYGRKVDLFVPLMDGRMIALEAKILSSSLNSVKRLNNDTAAKAKHLADAGGRNIINVALLSGVFKFSSLERAQNSGLYLVWAHRMEEFLDWIETQI